MEQSRIAAFLPSQQLRDAIRETAHRFTDRELVMIAEQYAPIRKDCMDALETIAEQTDDPDTRELAERLLAYHREALERFLAAEPESEVMVDAYIQQMSRNEESGKYSLFLAAPQDEQGLFPSYYVYDMELTEEEAIRANFAVAEHKRNIERLKTRIQFQKANGESLYFVRK